MAESHEDDLFRKSSMSFGEHLEELRRRLFRAALWLLGGVIIGFIIGQWAVTFITAPMQKALDQFYDAKTQAELADLRTTLPPGSKALYGAGYVSDQVYVQPDAVLDQLAHSFPALAKQSGTAKGGTPAPAGSSTKPAGHADAAKAMPAIARRPMAMRPPAVALAAVALAAVALAAVALAAVALAAVALAAVAPPTVYYFPSRFGGKAKTISAASSGLFSAMEPFMIWLKVALLAGAILASPMIFHELWMFIAAGLYPHERRYVHVFLPMSVGLFIAGVLMAFFVALPTVLKFLLGFNQYLSIDPEPRIEEYLSFALFLPLAFGVGFQLPLVMSFVNRIGLVSVETFLKQWRIAVLAIFVLAMILTPSPDIYTMSLLAVPMSILYFGGIGLCKWSTGRRPAGLGGE